MPHNIPRKELFQLIHDRSYQIPTQWSPTLLSKKKYWRQRIDGLTEYLDSRAYSKFSSTFNKNPKVHLRYRKKNLIANQYKIQELLETTFLFPCNLDFVDNLSRLLTQPTMHLTRYVKNESAHWFVICMAGFMLLRYFGGSFVQIPKKGFSVRLERVPVEVYLEQKINGDTGEYFNSWFYNLIVGLWQQTEEGKIFDGCSLDCINISYSI